MLHPDILTISYRHRYEIMRTFKEAIGFLDTVHLSLDLIRPDGEMVYFSCTPSHGYEICAKGYGAHDATVSPEYFMNREFYWWHEVEHKQYAKEITYLRQTRHGFRHGFMMVRKWDDFYLIYSFASGSNSREYVQNVEQSKDDLFALGDYVYNSMRDVYAEYTGHYVPPVIDRFYPYKGGKPEPRYSNFHQTSNGIFVPNKQPKRARNDHLRLVVDNIGQKNIQVRD